MADNADPGNRSLLSYKTHYSDYYYCRQINFPDSHVQPRLGKVETENMLRLLNITCQLTRMRKKRAKTREESSHFFSTRSSGAATFGILFAG